MWHSEISKFDQPSLSELRNCELTDGIIRILVRHQSMQPKQELNPCLIIATIEVKPEFQRQGHFKRFYNLSATASIWKRVIIEDVKNPHLERHLLEIGFTPLSSFHHDTFVSPEMFT